VQEVKVTIENKKEEEVKAISVKPDDPHGNLSLISTDISIVPNPIDIKNKSIRNMYQVKGIITLNFNT